jgi:ubiquinone/menaquinone biosynthesis C-methylase UbiE
MLPDPLYEAAKAVAPYGDDEHVRAITRACLDTGHRILQIHKLGATDAAHVAALLALADLPYGAAVLDAGCGVGAVAELMAEQRPDLSITLLNVSPAQLAMCPDGFPKIAASFHEIPVPAGSFDAVMFLYSIGHAQIETALAEAARVLHPGGVLFIYDLTAVDPARVISSLGYVPLSIPRVLKAASPLFHQGHVRIPQTTIDGFFEVMDRETYAHVFEGVHPVTYRMVRR